MAHGWSVYAFYTPDIYVHNIVKDAFELILDDPLEGADALADELHAYGGSRRSTLSAQRFAPGGGR